MNSNFKSTLIPILLIQGLYFVFQHVSPTREYWLAWYLAPQYTGLFVKPYCSAMTTGQDIEFSGKRMFMTCTGHSTLTDKERTDWLKNKNGRSEIQNIAMSDPSVKAFYYDDYRVAILLPKDFPGPNTFIYFLR